MNTERTPLKNSVSEKRTGPMENDFPEETDKICNEEISDNDKIMETMLDILRRNHNVKLKKLILNRSSFARTVENLLALSYLVKDGRAEIQVDEERCHQVFPRNAPSANEILSGEVSFKHFIFRFDFKDWKLMVESVGSEEIMPHRNE